MGLARVSVHSMSDHGPDSSTDGTHATPEVVSWVLSDGRRRRALAHLYEHGSVTLDELTDRLAEQSGDDPRRVRRSFNNHHIPIMQEAGLVEYDESTERLTLGQLSSEVDDLFATTLDADDATLDG